jgi:hypothetical protein
MFDNVGVGIFKHSSLMGTFTFPPPLYYIESSTIYIISFDTNNSFDLSFVSLSVVNPCLHTRFTLTISKIGQGHWVVPHPSKVGYLGLSIPLTMVKIDYQAIEMASIDLHQNLHPSMDYD